VSTGGLIITIKSSSIDISSLELNNLFYYLVISLIYYSLSSLLTPIIIGSKDYIMSFWIQTASYVTGSPSPIKLGIPIKIYLFKKYLNVPITKTTSAIIYESLIRIIVLFVMVPSFGGLHYLKIINNNIYLVFPILIIISIILILFNYMSGGLIEKIKRNIFVFKSEFITIIKNLSAAVKITIIQIILQLIYILRIMFLLKCIGVESLTLFQISRSVIATSLLTMLSMIPGGYGVRELSMIFLLQSEGLDNAKSIFISLADRSLQLMIAMILGIFASIYFTYFNKSDSNLKNEDL